MKSRLGPGWVPTQHGAWAMLASPLLVGGIAGGWSWSLLPLTLCWFLGYCAFFAASQWLRAAPARRRPYRQPVLTYTAAAAASGAALLAMDASLATWAPLFVVPLLVGLWAASRRADRELWAGLATVVAAAAMTLVAADAGGEVTARIYKLAAVQLAYFGGTVFYVKSAIRERGNQVFLAISVLFHTLATAVIAWISWLLGPVFAAWTLRASVLPPRGLSPKVLGIGELIATVVVALVSLRAV